MIIADIHGSLTALRTALSHYEEEHCDMLLLLGDIINYGPRNGLPEGLDAMGVADELNKYADKIIAVRGNCDSEVDSMILHFPMMSDYTMVCDGPRRLLLTHGHLDIPARGCDYYLSGHTHLQGIEERDGVTYCNPGSITFPKGGNQPTFAIYDDGEITIRRMDGSKL